MRVARQLIERSPVVKTLIEFGEVMRTPDLERLLALAALVLSIVNGLILVRVHIRDRAKLEISPVHPHMYQWWFVKPKGKCQVNTKGIMSPSLCLGMCRWLRPEGHILPL